MLASIKQNSLAILNLQVAQQVSALFMGESSKFPKSWTFEIQVLKLVVCLQIINIFKLNGQLSFDELKINQRSYNNLPNSAFWGLLSFESQPQNREFRNNPVNFHPCLLYLFWRCGLNNSKMATMVVAILDKRMQFGFHILLRKPIKF